MAVCTLPSVSTWTSGVEYLSAWWAVTLAAVTPSCCIRCTARCSDEGILMAAGEPEGGDVRMVSGTVMDGAWATLPVSSTVVLAVEALPASTKSNVTPHVAGWLEKITHALQHRGFGARWH